MLSRYGAATTVRHQQFRTLHGATPGRDVKRRCSICIDSGRICTTQQKQQLTKLVLRQLEKLSLKSTTITLETVDIDTESYAKAVIA